MLQEFRKDRALENFERLGITKETCHADERIGVQRIQFFAIALEELRVVFQRVFLIQYHASRDATLDGGGFVEGEINSRMVS